MFYSHEILTSRKYGVATVWLVATLGAKSGTRKVTRKAILDVNVQKACDTIIEPEAPMALRLQSNLLYGVSRVYDQQCNYVLADSQAAQNNMRALLKAVKGNDLDSNTIKARPDQLMLMDDPAFDPDIALPALDFDLSVLQIGESQQSRSTQSMMSIHGRSDSASSLAPSVGINLPSSSIHDRSYHIPHDPFNASALQKQAPAPGHDVFGDEAELFQDDMQFEFDADGEMRDIGSDEINARRANTAPGNDSAASGRVRKEHEDGQILPSMAGDNFNLDYDGDVMLPDAEPFSVAAGNFGRSDQPQSQVTNLSLVYSEEESSVSAEATQKRRKPKGHKSLAKDEKTELSNADLRTWQQKYLDNMIAVSLIRMNKIANAQAKKNAVSFVYGAGLNGVGAGISSSKIPSPLLIFSGESLLSMVTGNPLPSVEPKVKKGTKRASEDAEDHEHGSSPKRSRHGDQEHEHEDEFGRGFEDDVGMVMHNSIEVGRDAGSAIKDYPSSAMMPWNVSQSLNSHQRGATSSLRGRLPSIGSRRLTSASPLISRGVPLPDMDQFGFMDENQVMYGRDDIGSSDGKGNPQDRSMSSAQAEAAEFENYGPAAQVDTQTAGASQWVRDVLDRESGNFFDYVSNTISEKYGDDLALEDADENDKHVTFEELFDPETNTKMVAAQAFYHVLSLATKAKVWVMQDGIFEPFGEIQVGIIA